MTYKKTSVVLRVLKPFHYGLWHPFSSSPSLWIFLWQRDIMVSSKDSKLYGAILLQLKPIHLIYSLLSLLHDSSISQQCPAHLDWSQESATERWREGLISQLCSPHPLPTYFVTQPVPPDSFTDSVPSLHNQQSREKPFKFLILTD